jgi:hypothetical protein
LCPTRLGPTRAHGRHHRCPAAEPRHHGSTLSSFGLVDESVLHLLLRESPEALATTTTTTTTTTKEARVVVAVAQFTTHSLQRLKVAQRSCNRLETSPPSKRARHLAICVPISHITTCMLYTKLYCGPMWTHISAKSTFDN